MEVGGGEDILPWKGGA